MQYTTEQYREELHLPFRGHTSVYVYIGLINEKCQRSAHITSSKSGSEAYLYEASSDNYQGVTSRESDGHITFTFDGYENNIAGLTITFLDSYDFITVSNGTKQETYEVDGVDEFIFDDGYTDCHYLTITPSSGKLKIKQITFGIGLQFAGKQIMTTNRENIVSHISNELPRKNFTFVINNRDKLFNKDNPFGYGDYLNEKQVIRYEYHREMVEDDTDYQIKGGVVLLKSWSSDDYEAKFMCVGKLQYMDSLYYKGQYYPNGETAYNIAEDILQNAGETEYVLDDSLKNIKFFNPIPVVAYNEALKMIANASRCTLSEDRDGRICIIDADRPSFIVDVNFTGATSYSTPSTIFRDNSANNYADAEFNYAKADGALLFYPEKETTLSVGFVSSELADNDGLFSNDPKITAKFASEYIINRLIFKFAYVVPTQMTVSAYLDDVLVDSEVFTEIELSTVYEYGGTIDYLEITFDSAVTNQRIHLNNIEIEGQIDYELTYHELKDTPVANSLEKVSNVKVHIYNYYKEGEETGQRQGSYVDVTQYDNSGGGQTVDISTDALGAVGIATIEAVVGENLAIFNDACYDIAVDYGTIKEQGAYYVVVESDKQTTITVTGKKFTVTDNVYQVDIHEEGSEKNSHNPLIGTLTLAQIQGKWLKDYYDDDIQYTLTYRGDTALDADDLIYLENHFVWYNQIRIEEETISTSTGMDFTCHLLARRTSYQVPATLDEARVGFCRVGEAVVGDESDI